MKRNAPIGEVPCPFTGCLVCCPLSKYQPRADGRRSAFTGKWYAECVDHGRIDGASGSATQDYLIERGKVWGAEKPDVPESEKPEIPAEKPEQPKLSQASQKPENPATPPEPKPEIPVSPQRPAKQKPGLLDW